MKQCIQKIVTKNPRKSEMTDCGKMENLLLNGIPKIYCNIINIIK